LDGAVLDAAADEADGRTGHIDYDPRITRRKDTVPSRDQLTLGQRRVGSTLDGP
jgi:hypothetical protein